MRLRTQITIDAPAETVWHIVGPGFADVARWASAIRASHAVDRSPGDGCAGGRGRVCETGLRLAPRVTETLVAYDDAARTLTYEGSGLPRFVAAARNRWHVTPLSPGRCRFTLDATLELRGLARIAAPLLRPRLAVEGRRLASDLKRYVEGGEVSRREAASAHAAQSRRPHGVQQPVEDVTFAVAPARHRQSLDGG